MERKMRSERIKRIREVISAIKKYQMCGPGDDPDQVTNVTIGFRSLVIQLKRLAGPLLPESIAGRLESINPEVNDIYSAYEAASELSPLVLEIRKVMDSRNDMPVPISSSNYLIDSRLLELLESTNSSTIDLIPLSRLCSEVNSCYSQGNLIAAILLMRAILNFVPPIFGQDTFVQVVADMGKSLKVLFANLEDGLRKIADYYTHRRIGGSEMYPSIAQVEPFKPAFEVLLQEVIHQVGKAN